MTSVGAAVDTILSHSKEFGAAPIKASAPNQELYFSCPTICSAKFAGSG